MFAEIKYMVGLTIFNGKRKDWVHCAVKDTNNEVSYHTDGTDGPQQQRAVEEEADWVASVEEGPKTTTSLNININICIIWKSWHEKQKKDAESAATSTCESRR